MKTLNLISKTEQDGHLRLDIPTDVANGAVEVVVIINELERKGATDYDFKDLAGQLHWEGDILAEQKRLRDEW